MKRLLGLVFFSLFLFSFFVSADILSVNPDYVDERNVVVDAVDRLVTLQNSDGGWNWVITDITSPGGSTANNIEGVTGMGLLDLYSLTGNSDYIDAAKDTGEYLIDYLFSGSSVDITKRVNAFDIVFLYNLGQASGDNDYTDAADDLLNNVLTDDNFWAHNFGSFCSDSTGCTAQNMFDAIDNRRGSDLGIMLWDLSLWTTAAELGGKNSWANDMKNIMDNQYSNLESYVGNYYIIGLSGLILATGNSDAVDDLISEQDPDGSWDGWIQDTAYALMALKSAGEINEASDAMDYLVNHFGYDSINGWKEPGDEEYSEVTSEATQAIFDFIYVPGTYYTIQDAITSASNGDTINVGDGTFDENLNVDKGISLIGTGYSATTTLNGNIVISSDNVVVQGFNINQISPEVSITLDTSLSDRDDISILENQFNMPTSPAIGIFLGNTDNTKVSDIIINDNVFNGPSDMICNPWKIGGSFGDGMNIEVVDVDFTGNTVDSCSIPINLQDSNINDVLIDNNIFRNTDGVVYIWADSGSNPSGALSNFVFTNNDVDSTNSYGVGIDVFGSTFDDSNFDSGNRINYNNFVGIAGAHGFEGVSLTSPVISYELDATSNWWGDCKGPGGVGPGSGSGVSANVDYDPWIGICITDELDDSCAYDSKQVVLSAKPTSNFTISNVTFSVSMDGAGGVGLVRETSDGRYNVTLNTTGLGGQTIKWMVHAEDEFGNVYNNSWKDLYIRERTELSVDPLAPDGLNNWYITEPEFTLTNDPFYGENIYYRWDGTGSHLYSTPFGLEDIPNPPNITAGTLELTYWSDYGCDLEPEQSQMFYIDLTPVEITDEYPQEGETIEIGNPLIRIDLDDLYGTNSGIKESSIVMEIDGGSVVPDITNITDMEKLLTYDTTGLNESSHTIYVYVEDNAGHVSEKTWQFDVDLGEIDFLTINSPLAGNYDERRHLLDITISETAEKLEYMDSADTRPRFKRLCKNCDDYSRMKSFKDGWHDLIIRATSYTGLTKEETVSFLVDSKKPKIHKTEPKRRGYANGIFTVQYTEDNVDNGYVKLFWKESDELTYNEVELTGCENGKRQECSTDRSNDIAGIENEIEYYFEISDGINDPVQSRVVDRLTVDTYNPIVTINEPIDSTYGKSVPFDIAVNEEVTGDSEDVKLYYKNESDSRYRTLCTRCSSYDRTRSFRAGDYNLEIKAVDKAGNEGSSYVSFTVA